MEKKEARRGRKREAEDGGLDEERINREYPEDGGEREEPKGEKRKAVDDEIQRERADGRAAPSGDGMAVEAVMRNDEDAWDDVKGGWLDRGEVHKARMEEVGFMKDKKVWDEVPRRDAEGQRIVSVKWVDTNKGTEEHPEMRCRLVARDFRCGDKDREDLFAATPPWELKRLLMSHAADRSGGKIRKMLLVDVKKAHLNSDCKEEVYIELPPEVGAGADKVGKLRRWLYGFRPAAAAWEYHYAGKLEEEGFVRGLATPVSFYHREKDINVVVHGDDFTFTGDDPGLDWAEDLMRRWYEVKVRARLGPGDRDDKKATLLGRIIRWHDWGVSCEADPKYRRTVMEALGLKEDSKSLTTPGTKDEVKGEDSLPRVLGDDCEYRSIVATINFMAMDMPDLQYSCKEACRDMSAPTELSWAKVKRIGRYLVGREAVIWKFPWKNGHGGWKVYTDSDWAGDKETRKSTSGGILMLGEHCMKTWSTTQSSPALSSCEAEYYAVVDGASRALGMQTAAKELGIMIDDLAVEMATDSSGAKTFASRRGSGRIRHIEVKWLWLQQAVADGRFRMTKVAGVLNPADILTKYKGLRDYEQQLRRVNVEIAVRSPERMSWADAWEEEQEALAEEVYLVDECPRTCEMPRSRRVIGKGDTSYSPEVISGAYAAAEGECWEHDTHGSAKPRFGSRRSELKRFASQCSRS